MCLDLHLKGEVGAPLNRFKPSRKYFTVPRGYFFCGSFMFFSVLCLLCHCTRLFICALWSPAWNNFEFVTFPLVFCVRCGT